MIGHILDKHFDTDDPEKKGFMNCAFSIKYKFWITQVEFQEAI